MKEIKREYYSYFVEETKKQDKVKNVILIILLVLVIGIIIVPIGYGMYFWIWLDNNLPQITEIDLTNITQKEVQRLIEYNFLEITEYPISIEFLVLTRSREFRETQFYITFSVNQSDYLQNPLERSDSTGYVSISKVEEKEQKVILKASTHFAMNAKPEKYKYLYELMEKYSER